MGSPSTHFPPILVLAGGRATRLKNLVDDRPKYLMPVNDELTFADLHLRWLADQGFNQVILSIGYLGEQIRTHCGDGRAWGLNITYLEDGAQPLGTGGAVKKALAAPLNFTELCITYGDTLLDFSVEDFLGTFRELQSQGALGCMTVYENKVPGHTCNIEFKNPWVHYDKLKPQSSWRFIDYGFLALHRRLIEQFTDERPLDLAQPISSASFLHQIAGYEVQNQFWEIGSPEALEAFRVRTKAALS